MAKGWIASRGPPECRPVRQRGMARIVAQGLSCARRSLAKRKSLLERQPEGHMLIPHLALSWPCHDACLLVAKAQRASGSGAVRPSGMARG